MKTFIATALLAVMGAGTCAAEFSDLQSLNAADVSMAAEKLGLKGLNSNEPTPAGAAAAAPAVLRTSEDVYFRSAPFSTKEKATAALQRILKDAKRQDIMVKDLPAVESLGKSYNFTVNFGPGLYIGKVESYAMNHAKEEMIISGVELGGGIHLETKYEPERGMSVYYVMPEGNEPQEVDAD